MNSEIASVSCPICSSSACYDFSSRDLMFELYQRYDYYCCSDCQTVFQYPMPLAEQISSFYPSDYSIFDQKSQVRALSQLKQALLWKKHGYSKLKPTAFYKFIANLAAPFYNFNRPDFVAEGLMLDVGCGNGRYLSTMRMLGWNVQGVELSEDGFKVCQQAGLNVHHGDLFSAKFPENSFDLITVRHVIEHVPEPVTFVTELAKILKPGGKLIIETPNSNALGRAIFSAKWFANEVPRHLFLFSPENLQRLTTQCGLTQLSTQLSTSPKIFLNSVDYVTKNTGKPSNKIRWKRMCARIYMWFARYTKRGDVIHSVFSK